MTAENERPPPLHSRVLTSLRETFFPAAFRDMLRGLREEWNEAGRQIDAEDDAAWNHRARLRAQRQIADELLTNPNISMRDVIRRYWEAGKPKPPSPTPPAHE